ncbi:conserved protein of unknown function [Candidatus Filomicrobium marinum]|uniref:LUD domain-containing protein n=1 Tax=Candidatus Filomicrobium marinum TaxID=1608628 RepID=A0A0D6J9M3_9HYPH|nr:MULTISPECIES: lactate utilization protein C [Filomicrobium]MCV0368743.1 lactate utilization protein C [Filomicrobium sp.]CFW99226.1 conserved protein of unknown function [Candidatus Filomicrobium marinum]CPR15021.1 conserved protein of unknown function [Candidatus Filomicrobium marinum]
MSRDQILAKVRAAISDATPQLQRRAAAEARVAKPSRSAPPLQRVSRPTQELIEVFKYELGRQSANVIEAQGSIPQSIAAYLQEAALPPTLRCGSDSRLTRLQWRDAPTLALQHGPAAAQDGIGLSHAFCGIAETGTLALLSGPENPVTLCFLPDTHIVVVRRSDIVASYEDAYVRLRHLLGERRMPRTLNLISGPSRTADIGGKIVIGAHGPRRLCVVIDNTN